MSAPDLVPASTRAFLSREPDAIAVSATSVWELAIKRKPGKLGEVSALARDLDAFVHEAIAFTSSRPCRSVPATRPWPASCRSITVTPSTGCSWRKARINDLIVVSPDAAFDPYGVTRRE